MKRQFLLAAGLGMVAPLVVAIPVGQVYADTFTVTNTNDSGAGSLRQALADANSTNGADIVAFAPSLTGTITLTTGPLIVSEPVTIDGPNSYDVIVSGNLSSRVMRIVSAGTVSVSGLTFTSGVTATGNGGCLEITDSDVTLDDIQMTTCTATQDNGGAVAATGSGSLTIGSLGAYIAGNSAGDGGGGIYTGAGVSLTILEGMITSNDATFNGGGVFAQEAPTISGAGLSNNYVGPAGYGGNLWVGDGAGLVLRDTYVSSGSAQHGGGIYVSSMSAGADGRIERCQISGNSAGAEGAGVLLDLLDDGVSAGTLRIRNTTIADNQAGTDGGGVYVRDRLVAGVSLEFATIVGNEAAADGDGAFLGGSGPTTISHSVLWGNKPTGIAADDIDTTTAVTVERSVLGETDLYWFGSLSLDAWSDAHVGVDPLLGDLADNGGAVHTMKPAAGSVLINGGATTLAGAPLYDARVLLRKRGGRYDVGAFEFQTPTAPQSVAAASRVDAVRVAWRAPSSRGDASILGYRIYRLTANGWKRVGTVGTATRSYLVTGLRSGTLFRFRVVAVNAGGAGALSAVVSRRAG